MINTRALSAVLLPSLLGCLVHCGPSSESTESAPSAYVGLQGFPSTDSAQAGVDEWDVEVAKVNGETFVIERGYTVNDGERTPVLGIVSSASGDVFVGDGQVRRSLDLGPARGAAVQRDFRAMSAAIAAETSTGEGPTVKPQTLEALDAPPPGRGSRLVERDSELIGDCRVTAQDRSNAYREMNESFKKMSANGVPPEALGSYWQKVDANAQSIAERAAKSRCALTTR